MNWPCVMQLEDSQIAVLQFTLKSVPTPSNCLILGSCTLHQRLDDVLVPEGAETIPEKFHTRRISVQLKSSTKPYNSPIQVQKSPLCGHHSPT